MIGLIVLTTCGQYVQSYHYMYDVNIHVTKHSDWTERTWTCTYRPVCICMCDVCFNIRDWTEHHWTMWSVLFVRYVGRML